MARDDLASKSVPRTVAFRDLLPGDLVQLALQPSQHRALGVLKPAWSYEDGEELAEGGPAWTAIGADGRILACFGAKLLWPAVGEYTGHAVLWALLAEGIGAAHLALTRFIAARIAESPIARLEAIVRADVKGEAGWPRLLGLGRPRVLRRWGPEGADHLLYERVL